MSGLDRIYASKLYKLSAHKDRIHSAIENPINAELVQQMSEYLSDESQQLLAEAVAEDQARQAPQDSKEAPAAAEASPHSAPPPFTGSPVSFDDFDVPELQDEFDDEAQPPEGEDALDEALTPEDGGDAEVVEVAEDSELTPIEGSVDVPTLDSDTLLGTFNSREDTAGVSRITIRGEEVWVYYQDSVNLNKVLDAVINLVESAGFSQLSFNRLARTDNAIVFELVNTTKSNG